MDIELGTHVHADVRVSVFHVHVRVCTLRVLYVPHVHVRVCTLRVVYVPHVHVRVCTLRVVYVPVHVCGCVAGYRQAWHVVAD